MSQRKSLSERIDEQLARKAQMEAEIKRLQQKQKAEERNKRTHRICTRGGMVEGMLPDTIKLTDEQYKIFIENTTANDYGKEILRKIITGKFVEKNKSSSDTPPAKQASSQ